MGNICSDNKPEAPATNQPAGAGDTQPMKPLGPAAGGELRIGVDAKAIAPTDVRPHLSGLTGQQPHLSGLTGQLPPAVGVVAPAPATLIGASQIEDLHLDAQHLEAVTKANVLHPTVDKKLSALAPFRSESHKEYHAKYSAFQKGGSIMKEKSTGNTYEGQMSKGVPHGFGKLLHSDGSITEGFFEEGKPVHVRRIIPNGTMYQGDFKDGAAHGPGYEIDPNGNVTECQTWQKGEPEGQVARRDAAGNSTFVGTISKGKKTGPCNWYDDRQKCRHQGNFVNDLLEGKGKRNHDNGQAYEGEFKAGVESGKGIMTFIDGRKFEGDFVNGKANGKGKLTTDTGKTVEVTFKDGVRV